jgi:hypothetical protein
MRESSVTEQLAAIKTLVTPASAVINMMLSKAVM